MQQKKSDLNPSGVSTRWAMAQALGDTVKSQTYIAWGKKKEKRKRERFLPPKILRYNLRYNSNDDIWNALSALYKQQKDPSCVSKSLSSAQAAWWHHHTACAQLVPSQLNPDINRQDRKIVLSCLSFTGVPWASPLKGSQHGGHPATTREPYSQQGEQPHLPSREGKHRWCEVKQKGGTSS